jgi:hypothetical protein
MVPLTSSSDYILLGTHLLKMSLSYIGIVGTPFKQIMYKGRGILKIGLMDKVGGLGFSFFLKLGEMNRGAFSSPEI